MTKALPSPKAKMFISALSTEAQLHARDQPARRLRLHAALVLARREAVEARLLETIECASFRELFGPAVTEGRALGGAHHDPLATDVVGSVQVHDVILQVEAGEDLLLLGRKLPVLRAVWPLGFVHVACCATDERDPEGKDCHFRAD